MMRSEHKSSRNRRDRKNWRKRCIIRLKTMLNTWKRCTGLRQARRRGKNSWCWTSLALSGKAIQLNGRYTNPLTIVKKTSLLNMVYQMFKACLILATITVHIHLNAARSRRRIGVSKREMLTIGVKSLMHLNLSLRNSTTWLKMKPLSQRTQITWRTCELKGNLKEISPELWMIAHGISTWKIKQWVSMKGLKRSEKEPN